jgi:dihydroxyacetone kinase-like predicted kinase
MYLTVEAARDAMRDALKESPGDLRVGLGAYARGALLGAKGNSGVILSQLIGALFRRIGQARPDDRAAQKSSLKACKKPQMQPSRQWALLSKAPS